VTQTILKNTTVAKVAGCCPRDWLADPDHIYVGRHVLIRSGKYEGDSWPNSGFGNPYKLDRNFTRAERIDGLFRYCKHLKDILNVQPAIRETFLQLQGKTLGCWCVNWGGNSDLPICHAAWLARIVDMYFHPDAKGAVVYRSGAIGLLTDESDRDDCVVFRKGVRV